MNKSILKKVLFLSWFLCTTGLLAQYTVNVTTPEGQTFAISGDSTKHNFKALVASYEGRFADAARLKIKALESGETTDEAIGYYDAACYMSLADNSEKAFVYLKKSMEAGYGDLGHALFDNDLEKLREDKRWKKVMRPYLKAYFRVHNKELTTMYGEDQAARLSGKIDWTKLNAEDSVRRLAVLKAIEKDQVKSAHDYYKAAMIMHHGKEVEDYQKAHELALKAIAFEEPHQMAPWLAAASKDRYLLKAGKPQWFGTQGLQFMKENNKMGIKPADIDTTAVSNEQRKAWNAPTIETIRAYLKNYEEAMALRSQARDK